MDIPEDNEESGADVKDTTEEELSALGATADERGNDAMIVDVATDAEGAVVVSGAVLGGGVNPPYVHTPSVPSGIYGMKVSMDVTKNVKKRKVIGATAGLRINKARSTH